MSKYLSSGFFVVLLAGGLLIILADGVVAQEAATPEVRPGTEPVAKKPPTIKELAKSLERVRRENAALQMRISQLESRLRELEQIDVAGLERRVRTLETSPGMDIYRELGIPRGKLLQTWHREMHRTDSDVKFPTQRDFEDWHLRDHQRRSRQLRTW